MLLCEVDSQTQFISRHATGGSIPGVLPRLSEAELNVTQSTNNTGNVCAGKSLLG